MNWLQIIQLWIQKLNWLQIIQPFFPTFQVGFFDFFGIFYGVFYKKVSPIIRLTDSSSFLFTLKSLIFFQFFFPTMNQDKNSFNMSSIV